MRNESISKPAEKTTIPEAPRAPGCQPCHATWTASANRMPPATVNDFTVPQSVKFRLPTTRSGVVADPEIPLSR